MDALDELFAKLRLELQESLQQVVRRCPNTLLFLTGRLHICDKVQSHISRAPEILPLSPRKHDIGLCFRIS